MTTPETSPQRWETRVIHLNITNDPPAPPAQGPPPPPSPAQNPLFSESYLKEEFPNHYAGNQQPGAEQSQHPAVQLQGFINGFGQEGWEFVGIFPVGQLVMMFFRRPLPSIPSPPPITPAIPDHPTSSSQATTLEEAIAPQAVPDAPPAWLANLLERLELLEAAAHPIASQPQPTRKPLPAVKAARSSTRSSVRVLNQLQRQQLPPEPSLPTLHAATALGLRSPGGLLTFGARHGFPPGLVKLVGNGMAAVYLGTEKRQSGGKSTRLWKVLPQSQLPPE